MRARPGRLAVVAGRHAAGELLRHDPQPLPWQARTSPRPHRRVSRVQRARPTQRRRVARLLPPRVRTMFAPGSHPQEHRVPPDTGYPAGTARVDHWPAAPWPTARQRPRTASDEAHLSLVRACPVQQTWLARQQRRTRPEYAEYAEQQRDRGGAGCNDGITPSHTSSLRESRRAAGIRRAGCRRR